MPQYLKKDATLSKHGVTITGDGLGNQGVFSVIGFQHINRKDKSAIAFGYWYVDKDTKEPFDSMRIEINEDDFDKYVSKAPTVEEQVGEMYLLLIKRVYDFVSDKAKLYNNNIPEEGEQHEFPMFEKYKDIVDDPRFI